MSFLFIVLMALIVVSVGVGAKYAFVSATGEDSSDGISKSELLVGSLIVCLVLAPLLTIFGNHIAKASAATYHEYWSGLEKTSDVMVTTCSRDGSCHHDYNCDPYWVMETYYTTDSKGHSHPHHHLVEHWHSCPYGTKEYTYTVKDTLGKTYTFADHIFGADTRPWRSNRGLPSNVATAPPEAWTMADQRIRNHTPGGTTSREDYKNYILAAQDDIFEKNSDAIAGYLKAGLLPKVTTAVYDQYHADKAYFVGSATPPNGGSKAAYEQAVQNFDGYLGYKAQGDFHLVYVDAAQVPEGDKYEQALAAYWQSDALGKDTLSKNGVVLVIGVDATSGKIVWSRGFTGMPEGNEALTVGFNRLEGTSADATALLAKDTGSLWNMMLTGPTAFHRVEMANYKYLYGDVKIGVGARILILTVGGLLSSLLWLLMLAVDLRIPFLERLRLQRGALATK